MAVHISQLIPGARLLAGPNMDCWRGYTELDEEAQGLISLRKQG